LAFNPAMQLCDSGTDYTYGYEIREQKASRGVPVVPDEPTDQANVRDDHDAEPKLEVGNLLFGDIKFRQNSWPL
jgi:hypothetical protein